MPNEPMWRESVNRPEDYLVGRDDTLVGYEDDGGEAFINLLFGTVPFEPVNAPIAIETGVTGAGVNAPTAVHAGVSSQKDGSVVVHAGRSETSDGPMLLSAGAGLAVDAPVVLTAGVVGLTTEAPVIIHAGRKVSEQASLVLSAGVAGVHTDAPILIWNGASFEWVPDLSQIVETVRYQTRVTRFESGREQRRARGTGRREWQLRFQRGDVDAAAIWDFYLDRGGVVRGFWWRNPLDGTTYLVRFADQIMTMDTMWRVLYRMGLRIVEVKP